VFAALLVLVIGVGACAPSAPRVVSAAEEPFPADFLQSGEWQETELVLVGFPERATTIEQLIAHIERFFTAGIRVARPGVGVKISVPDGAAQAREIYLFVTILGGANAATAGHQARLLVHHDEHGWWLDPASEMRVFCDHPLGGFSGKACH
jgi:hypothetical protein